MLRFLLTAAVCFVGFELEADEQQDELVTAGFQLAIAAGCRANYSDYELFEVAFDRFASLAEKAAPPLSSEELLGVKKELYETEAEEGDNVFLRAFCEEIRQQLLPE